MSRSRFKSALLLGAGNDVPLKNPALTRNYSLIVCADGGASLAKTWGLKPDLIIGDQDSLDSETKAYWEGKAVSFQRFPVEKDETDLDLALTWALEQGATQVSLTGAWGGRVDHSLGNLALLYRLALLDIPNQLLTRNQILSATRSKFISQVQTGAIVSLLPLNSTVQGVTTSGLKYGLEKATLIQGSTLALSNEATQAEIFVEVKKGVLLIVLEH